MVKEEAVLNALEDIRPVLQSDGGDVEFVEVQGTTVKVRLTGACHGCPSRESTLLYVVQRAIQEQEPEIRQVTLANL
jgi:Fe-S cluster biogenesis protein NfuA